MAITLTYNDTTVELSDRLQWTDEYDWSRVEQSAEYGITGALILDEAERQDGRPITLDGTSTAVWMPREQCDLMQAWADLPGAQFTLVLRSVARNVIFDQKKGGFSAKPTRNLVEAEITPQRNYLPKFQFLEVLP